MINVVNRLGAGSAGAITDFRARLAGEGLDPEVVRVPEHHVSAGGHRLPATAVRELQRRILAETAAIEADRREVVDRVVRSTATEAVDLADEVGALIESTEEKSAQAQARMEEVARTLDVSSLCEGLSPEARPGRALAGLVWAWRSRLGEEEWTEAAAIIEHRLVSIVEAEVREAVTGQDQGGRLSERTVQALRERTASSAEKWLDRLEDLAGPSRRFIGRLTTLVLAEAAATGLRTPAFDYFFEDGSLIVRAHRALVGPLEEVLRTVGSEMSVADNVGSSRETADRIRELAAAVSARSHFADA